jgi:hypothetical protein
VSGWIRALLNFKSEINLCALVMSKIAGEELNFGSVVVATLSELGHWSEFEKLWVGSDSERMYCLMSHMICFSSSLFAIIGSVDKDCIYLGIYESKTRSRARARTEA